MSRLILIVDDVPDCQEALAIALLSIPGADVRSVRSAAEALEVLHGAGPVAALITDLNMPRVDGFELIAQLRASVRFARLPIVVVSADGDISTPQRIRNLGANAFFQKPYSPAAVTHALRRLLHEKSDFGS